MPEGYIYKRGSSWSIMVDIPSTDGKRKRRCKGRLSAGIGEHVSTF